MFTIHRVPTRINPSDLNTKKLSVERRNLVSSLCGVFPHVSSEREGAETLFSRRIHRQVTARLVQALQGLAVTVTRLQGCTLSDAGGALRGERALHAPVQGSAWYVVLLVLATPCSMHPGRPLGPQHGGNQQQGASSSSRPTPGTLSSKML